MNCLHPEIQLCLALDRELVEYPECRGLNNRDSKSFYNVELHCEITVVLQAPRTGSRET